VLLGDRDVFRPAERRASLNTLVAQTQLPLGLPPFHYLATATAQAFGPYGAPPGFHFECIAIGLSAGLLLGVSAVAGTRRSDRPRGVAV
jgi:hypothetical protein